MPADAVEIQQEGLRIPPGACSRRACAADAPGQQPHARWSGPATSTPRSAPTSSGAARLAELVAERGARGRGDRLRRAADARPPSRRSPTACGRSRTCSTPPARRRRSSTRCASPCTLTKAAASLTFDFTGTDPQQPGNVNAVEAVTVSAVAFAVRGAVDPTIPANAGSLRPVRVVVAARHGGGRAAARRRRRRQRRGQPAGGRRVPRRPGPGPPGPGGRRRPGHDEQRHRRRLAAGSTTRRSPAGRAPAPGATA